MFSLIKQVFFVLLSFIVLLSLSMRRWFLWPKQCPSLNDEPCIVRPTLIDLNPVEIKYYPFKISLDKCSGSCNVLYQKICVPQKKKKKKEDINDVKVLNIITNKYKGKTYFMWF